MNAWIWLILGPVDFEIKHDLYQTIYMIHILLNYINNVIEIIMRTIWKYWKRSRSSGRITNEFKNFNFAYSNDFEIAAKKNFFDTVLAHGDGTIVNRPTPSHISLGNFQIQGLS